MFDFFGIVCGCTTANIATSVGEVVVDCLDGFLVGYGNGGCFGGRNCSSVCAFE